MLQLALVQRPVRHSHSLPTAVSPSGAWWLSCTVKLLPARATWSWFVRSSSSESFLKLIERGLG